MFIGKPSQEEEQQLTPFDLVHHNAILGCKAWNVETSSKDPKIITFEKSNEAIWYHSNIKDILFNSVLDASYDPKYFSKFINKIALNAMQAGSDIAWLVADPNKLTDFHRNEFTKFNFTECAGTTGMHLDLQHFYANKMRELQSEIKSKINIKPKLIKTPERLRQWAKLLFQVYNFPHDLAEKWYELHLPLGFSKNSAWQHLEIEINGEIIGTASNYLGPTPKNSSFANLAVSSSYRGKGLGRLLTITALKHLAEIGYTDVTLYASSEALKLYKELGFSVLKKNTFFVRYHNKA